MPTILRLNGLNVRIYPNDHRPPHVHIIGANGEAVITIGQTARLVRVTGLSGREVSEAQDIVRANETILMEAWEKIHGR